MKKIRSRSGHRTTVITLAVTAWRQLKDSAALTASLQILEALSNCRAIADIKIAWVTSFQTVRCEAPTFNAQ